MHLLSRFRVSKLNELEPLCGSMRNNALHDALV